MDTKGLGRRNCCCFWSDSTTSHALCSSICEEYVKGRYASCSASERTRREAEIRIQMSGSSAVLMVGSHEIGKARANGTSKGAQSEASRRLVLHRLDPSMSHSSEATPFECTTNDSDISCAHLPMAGKATTSAEKKSTDDEDQTICHSECRRQHRCLDPSPFGICSPIDLQRRERALHCRQARKQILKWSGRVQSSTCRPTLVQPGILMASRLFKR